jgi:hypothetical protein
MQVNTENERFDKPGVENSQPFRASTHVNGGLVRLDRSGAPTIKVDRANVGGPSRSIGS